MINWMFFPRSKKIPDFIKSKVVNTFENHQKTIDSSSNQLKSNDVLAVVRNDLISFGYLVEASKKNIDKINVPVLFGINGTLEKYFDADAYSETDKVVIEVEAGRGVTNYQFLKDLFQACVMHEVDYLVIAVRNVYRSSKDFEKVIAFMEALYSSEKFKIPLSGVLIIGY